MSYNDKIKNFEAMTQLIEQEYPVKALSIDGSDSISYQSHEDSHYERNCNDEAMNDQDG